MDGLDSGGNRAELLALRPRLGILIGPQKLAEMAPSFATPTPNLYMAAAREKGVLAYYFILKDVNVAQRRVLGWTKLPDETWRRLDLPWPDVLYVRTVTPRKAKSLAIYEALRADCQVINQTNTLPKWLCHDILQRYWDTRGYLPDMRQVKSIDDVRQMLVKHQVVFLKPDSGTGGKRIIRLQLLSGASMQWHLSTGPIEGEQLEWRQAAERLAPLIAKRRYVAQQGVELMKVGGRKADVRMVMQRQEQGIWRPHNYVLRVARENEVVTNLEQGGERGELEDGLKLRGCSDTRIEIVKLRLLRAGVSIAERLHQRLGPMGEIGLDFALNEDYRIWLIEANARPDLKDDVMPESLPPKYLHTAGYAVYLWSKKR